MDNDPPCPGLLGGTIIAFLDAVAYISFSEIQIAYFSP